MSNNTEKGANMSPKILRLPAVKYRSGDSRSTTYLRITQGLWTTPVHLGPRAVGWPDYECDALIAARIAGKTEDEIRTLVTKLEADRKFCTGGLAVDRNQSTSFQKAGSMQ